MCPHLIDPNLVLLKLPYPLIPPFKFDDRAQRGPCKDSERIENICSFFLRRRGRYQLRALTHLKPHDRGCMYRSEGIR